MREIRRGKKSYIIRTKSRTWQSIYYYYYYVYRYVCAVTYDEYVRDVSGVPRLTRTVSRDRDPIIYIILCEVIARRICASRKENGRCTPAVPVVHLYVLYYIIAAVTVHIAYICRPLSDEIIEIKNILPFADRYIGV